MYVSLCYVHLSKCHVFCLVFYAPPLGDGAYNLPSYILPSVNFRQRISCLVYIGLIWYLVWSIIKVSCTMSHLFRSVLCLLTVCHYKGICVPWTYFLFVCLIYLKYDILLKSLIDLSQLFMLRSVLFALYRPSLMVVPHLSQVPFSQITIVSM